MRSWPPHPIDITAPCRRGRERNGIRAHRDTSLVSADRAVLDGIPCTTPARTLLDLAGVVPPAELRQALAQAEVDRVADFTALREVASRNRGRRGVRRLRMLIDELDPAIRKTRSELERRFLRLCRDAGLPAPEVNETLDLGDLCLMPDFLWRKERLIVELDGWRYHGTRSAFERDPRRRQRLQLAGWRVTSATWTQVVREPAQLARVVRGLLSVDGGPKGQLGVDKTAHQRRATDRSGPRH
jgi:very-short-patch-repair endonuclease